MTEGRKFLLNQCAGLADMLSQSLDQIELHEAEVRRLKSENAALQSKVEVLEGRAARPASSTDRFLDKNGALSDRA
jgi:hypothetical protein